MAGSRTSWRRGPDSLGHHPALAGGGPAASVAHLPEPRPPVRQLTQAMAVVGAGRSRPPDRRPPRATRSAILPARSPNDRQLAIARSSWSRRRSSPPSARCRPRSRTGSAIRSRVSAPPRSWSAGTRRRPSATEHLDAIIEEVDRLDRRISHLLSFSRPAPFHPMAESLPRLIEELLPAVARPIREQQVDLRDGGPGRPSEVRVDPMQLEQASWRSCPTRSTRCRGADSSGSAPSCPTARSPRRGALGLAAEPVATMTTLPATYAKAVEAEAVAFARQHVAYVKTANLNFVTYQAGGLAAARVKKFADLC